MNNINKHAEVLFYEDGFKCDMCDAVASCAIISTLGDDHLRICKKCLKEIIKGIDKE